MPANYVLLERIELNASAASVTFSNIPQSGYTDLKVVVSARNDAATTVGGLWIRFNGLNSNLSSRVLYGTGSAAGSFSDSQIFAYSDAASATSSTFSNVEYYIPNYNSTTANKSVSVDSVMENNATAASMALTAGLWSSTAAITSMEILTFNNSNSAAANFVSGSTFSLYGLAAVGTTPAIAPKASGGDVIDYDGTYWIHTFLTSGTFTPAVGLTCDLLLVGAGGGGAGANGTYLGGGGAGLVVQQSSLSVSASSKTVTVGAGGAGNIATNATGGAGTSSSIVLSSTYTATGGNGGYPNGNGGSNASYSGGAGNTGGGGGAGSSANGAASSGINTGGNGGAGTTPTILGYAIAGGGGGGGNNTGGTGGGAGGGLGSTDTPSNLGTAPTTYGSGGAGGRNNTVSTGASGVVIIRYLAA